MDKTRKEWLKLFLLRESNCSLYPPNYHSHFNSQQIPHSPKKSAVKKLKREKVKPGNEAIIDHDNIFIQGRSQKSGQGGAIVLFDIVWI